MCSKHTDCDKHRKGSAMKLLTGEQVAELLGFSVAMIRDKTFRLRNGLKSIKIGRNRRFLESDIIKLIEDAQTEAAKQGEQ
jgi:predicted DNA-binding transcriptional regulator AlpA